MLLRGFEVSPRSVKAARDLSGEPKHVFPLKEKKCGKNWDSPEHIASSSLLSRNDSWEISLHRHLALTQNLQCCQVLKGIF